MLVLPHGLVRARRDISVDENDPRVLGSEYPYEVGTLPVDYDEGPTSAALAVRWRALENVQVAREAQRIEGRTVLESVF